MLFIAIFILVGLGILSYCVLKDNWPKYKHSIQIAITTGLVVALPWIATGLCLGFRSIWIALNNPAAVDWEVTGSMLTAVVGIPGIGIAVVLGVLEYQKWREAQEIKDKNKSAAEKATKDELPVEDEKQLIPPPDQV